MRYLVVVPILAAAAVLRVVFRRIATHQPPFPGVSNRINTQVHRINQS